jgi:hypothetical protein
MLEYILLSVLIILLIYFTNRRQTIIIKPERRVYLDPYNNYIYELKNDYYSYSPNQRNIINYEYKNLDHYDHNGRYHGMFHGIRPNNIVVRSNISGAFRGMNKSIH